MKVKAKSRYRDLKESYSLGYLYAIIGYVIVLCLFAVIIFAMWRNLIIISITLIVCAIAGLIMFSQSSKDFVVEMTDGGLVIDNQLVNEEDIISWAVVDLGDMLEIVLRVSNYGSPFMYFYLQDNTKETFDFIAYLRRDYNYDDQMPKSNPIHRILRIVKLK